MKRQRLLKAASESDHGTSSDATAAMVNQINRGIADGMTLQVTQIGQYVLDTVFQSDP
jgi:hypothetical protein